MPGIRFVRLPRVFRTAAFRLTALYVGLFTLSVLVLGGVAYWTTRLALEAQMHARIVAETAVLGEEFRTAGIDGLRATIERRQNVPGALDYLLQSADGTRLTGELPPPRHGGGWSDVTITSRDGEQHHHERVRALAVALPGGAMLVVGQGLDGLRDAEEAILAGLAWVIAAAVVLGFGGGLLLSRGFLRRVDAIARTAEAISGGDLAQRIPLDGTGDDLDRLAGVLNRMLDRIGVLMDSVRQVSTDIAHDLRTPLSRLLQRLDGARAEARTAEDYAAAIDAASAEAREILATFAALLEIAQVESGAERLAQENVDLGGLAATVVEAFAPSAEEQGRVLVAEATPPLQVRGNRELLTQLLVNLVENSLRHTPPGTRVAVSLRQPAAGGVELRVEDNGPGIPAAERGLVLRRFYRCESSRTTPGNGLGLSLVAAIAALHHAELRLGDAAPGLRVVLVFRASRA